MAQLVMEVRGELTVFTASLCNGTKYNSRPTRTCPGGGVPTAVVKKCN